MKLAFRGWQNILLFLCINTDIHTPCKQIYNIHMVLKVHRVGYYEKCLQGLPVGAKIIKEKLRNTDVTIYFQYCPVSVHR